MLELGEILFLFLFKVHSFFTLRNKIKVTKAKKAFIWITFSSVLSNNVFTEKYSIACPKNVFREKRIHAGIEYNIIKMK